MLYRIFLKLLLQRKRDYLRVILSGIFVVFLIFFSASVSGCLVFVSEGAEPTMTKIILEIEQKFLIPYLLLLLLMFLILIGYIRKRAVDYSMLKILGIQIGHRRRFVGLEYFGIVVGSLLGGLLIGSVGSRFVKVQMEQIFANTIEHIVLGTAPLKLTLVIGVLMFGVGFMLCDLYVSSMGIDYVVSGGKKSGKAARKSWALSALAILLLLMSAVTICTYWGRIGYPVPTALAVFALVLLVLFFGAAYLYRLRKRKKKYYRKILWLDSWYHQFYSHANIAYVIGAFFLVLAFWFNLVLVSHLPIIQNENYPYDLVWGANDTDIDFLETLKEDYGVEYQAFSSFRVVSGDGAEHTGISVSTYEQLTGKSLNLKTGEIYIIYQEDRSERGGFGIDFTRMKPRLYIGASQEDIWSNAGVQYAPSRQAFGNDYEIAGTEYCIITGNFRTRLLDIDANRGLFSDTFEEIIVFSDRDFEQLREGVSGSNMTVLMNCPEQEKEVAEKIIDYASEHSQVNFFDQDGGNLIYEKETEQIIDRKDKLLNVSAMLIDMLTLVVCMVFALLEEASSEYEHLEWKLLFYSCNGMIVKKQKHVVYRELLMTAKAALAVALPVTLLLSLVKILYMGMSLKWTVIYLAETTGLMAGLSVLLLFMVRVYAWKCYRRIERRIRNE